MRTLALFSFLLTLAVAPATFSQDSASVTPGLVKVEF